MKRKRDTAPSNPVENGAQGTKRAKGQQKGQQRGQQKGTVAAPALADSPLTIQIVAGSYDRVLHGLTATVMLKNGEVQFADTFLFNAHTSAIRCLALSPPSVPVPGQAQKVMLATGSTDERINVYNLSAHPPRRTADQDLISSIARRPIAENSKNRELGTLLHHSATVTRLVFPTRSKLLSASEDSTVAVTRTRDWSLLSTIKAPIPKAYGRPSGDTAALGATPSGVNDFAIHPSMKVMISVGRGERCMRLWNLVTGKKAGVLNFGRDMLQDMGESRHSSGEGRRVVWGSSGAGEDEFAVAFDRNVAVFGMDSRPRCKALPDTRTKVHDLCYIRLGDDEKTEDKAEGKAEREAEDAAVLAVSTEDGRIMFFSTRAEDLEEAPPPAAVPAAAAAAAAATSTDKKKAAVVHLPTARLVSQLGGKAAGVTGRIKAFSVLPATDHDGTKILLIVSAGSDGVIRVWKLSVDKDLKLSEKEQAGRQVGQLLGAYETQNRITCVAAFVMIPRPEGVEDSEDEEEGEQEGEGKEGSGSDSDSD